MEYVGELPRQFGMSGYEDAARSDGQSGDAVTFATICRKCGESGWYCGCSNENEV